MGKLFVLKLNQKYVKDGTGEEYHWWHLVQIDYSSGLACVSSVLAYLRQPFRYHGQEAMQPIFVSVHGDIYHALLSVQSQQMGYELRVISDMAPGLCANQPHTESFREVIRFPSQ